MPEIIETAVTTDVQPSASTVDYVTVALAVYGLGELTNRTVKGVKKLRAKRAAIKLEKDRKAQQTPAAE